ncbi:HIT family protein [Patescibacteria group bacterium]
MSKNCVFCKIVEGKIPCYKVYEDDNFMAFLDIKPISKGHVLVISKKHFRWVEDVEPFEEYWMIAKKITTGIKKALLSDHVNYVTFGEGVPHAHIHIVPRFTNDNLGEVPDWTRDIKLTEEEMKVISEKIRQNV